MACGLRICLAALAVLALVAFSQTASAFSFDLPAKKYRCFTEEVPSNVWMSLRYTTSLGYAQVIDVKMTDPKGIVLHDQTEATKGAFETYSGDGGDFAVCFYSRMSSGVRASEGMRRTVRFEWNTGNEKIDYNALASHEHLKPMELHLRIMLDTVRALHGQYEYFKDRETQMRNTNEYVNARVMWFSIAVMAVLSVFAYWQVAHLKRFFKRKKLID